MHGIGGWLIAAGVSLVALGGILLLGERIFGRSPGGLPGDIVIRKGDFTFAFPIVTCLVLSVVGSLLLTLLWPVLSRFFGGGGRPH